VTKKKNNDGEVGSLEIGQGLKNYILYYGFTKFNVTMLLWILFAFSSIFMTYVLGKSAALDSRQFANYFLLALLATLIFLFTRSWIYSKSISNIGFDLNHILAKSTLSRNCAFFNKTP
jgi:hypothetical protein